jgi:hypothetical protein
MLFISTGATVAALGSYAWFPPLAIVIVGLSSYAAWPVFADALAALRHERRIKASAVDAVFIIGALAGRYYTAMALANGVYYLGQKLLQKTAHSARNRLDDLFGASPATVWTNEQHNNTKSFRL